METVKSLHNPSCEYCLGTGQYYWHTSNCNNDNCALAGGGETVKCDCTLMKVDEDRLFAPAVAEEGKYAP